MSFRERRALMRTEMTVQLLIRSPDPAQQLRSLHRRLNDDVIDRLIDISFLASKDDRLTEAVKWATLAVEASLLGGTALSRAEALAWRAQMLLRRHEQAKQPGFLDAAEEDLRVALAIHADLGPSEKHELAHSLLATVQEQGGDAGAAFGSRLAGARISVEGPAKTINAELRRLSHRYLDLEEDVQGELALAVLQEGTAMLSQTTDPPASADLLCMVAQAHRRLGQEEKAFAAWSQAADLYRDAGETGEEFHTRSIQFRYAATIENAEWARVAGEACIACAPPDIPAEVLTGRYHLLALTYKVLDRFDEATAAYRKAIGLLESADPDHDRSGPLLLELALLEGDSGRYAEARRDLEQVLARPNGEWDLWLAYATFADLLFRQFGDLGAALEHAERALQLSVSMARSMSCRADSLYRCGILHYNAGDMERAYRRFSHLIPILRENPDSTLIHVSYLYDHLVVVPSLTAAYQWAALACLATGRAEEAEEHRLQLRELAGGVEEIRLPAELTDEFLLASADGESLDSFAVQTSLSQGMSLRSSDPLGALRHFAEAAEQAAGSDSEMLLPHIQAESGRCLFLLGRLREADAAFRRGLALLGPDAESNLKYGCYLWLAQVAVARHQEEEALDFLALALSLMERFRSSMPSERGRMEFLQTVVPVYDMQVTVLMRAGRVVEAYAAIQRVKSRVLLDMLAEPIHRPIDHRVEAELADLRRRREEWYDSYVGELTPRPADMADYYSSDDYRLMAATVEIGERVRAANEERRRRGLFSEFESQQPPLDFASIQALLSS